MWLMSALLGTLLALCLGVFLVGKFVQRRVAKTSPALVLGLLLFAAGGTTLELIGFRMGWRPGRR